MQAYIMPTLACNKVDLYVYILCINKYLFDSRSRCINVYNVNNDGNVETVEKSLRNVVNTES